MLNMMDAKPTHRRCQSSGLPVIEQKSPGPDNVRVTELKAVMLRNRQTPLKTQPPPPPFPTFGSGTEQRIQDMLFCYQLELL